MFTPLEQYKIKQIIRIYNSWLDISITNVTIYLIISIIIIIMIMKQVNNKIIPENKYSIMIEMIYKKWEEIVEEIIGKKNKRYIPMIISIFSFILLNNIVGLIPYCYTTTSSFIITITMSLSIIIGITIIGIRKHSYKFINLFIPSGLNQGFTKYIIPLIFGIEIISYLSRIISLSVRLTANMMSGHTLLKIISTQGWSLLSIKYYYYILIIIPIIILIFFFLLEIGVAIIQAYVFALLTTTYIRDVEELH